MGAEKHKPSKKELLLDLENIRDLLGEAAPVSDSPPPENPSLEFPDSDGYLGSIPKLTNEVKPESSNNELQQMKNPSADQESDSDSASAQSTEEQSESAATEMQSAEAKKADNPFLPPHIRERLDLKKQQALVEELSLLGESLERSRKQIPKANIAKNTAESEPTSSSPREAYDSEAHNSTKLSVAEAEQLIDELVHAFLPKIESALKQRLREKLQISSPKKPTS